MSGINRSPSGLLSFFGIKNTGRNPSTIGDSLAPTLELVPWYLSQNSESLEFTGAVPGIGFNPGWFNVPENETWACLGCTCNSQAVLGAGAVLTIGGGWIRNPNLSIVAPLTTIGTRTTAGVVAAAWSPVGIVSFVPSGARIGVYCTELAAGPINVTMNLTVVRMQT